MGKVNDFLRKYHKRSGDERRHMGEEEHLSQREESMLKLRKSSGFLPPHNGRWHSGQEEQICQVGKAGDLAWTSSGRARGGSSEFRG